MGNLTQQKDTSLASTEGSFRETFENFLTNLNLFEKKVQK